MYSKCDDSRGIKRFEYIYCFLLRRISVDERKAQVDEIEFHTHTHTCTKEQLKRYIRAHPVFIEK